MGTTTSMVIATLVVVGCGGSGAPRSTPESEGGASADPPPRVAADAGVAVAPAPDAGPAVPAAPVSLLDRLPKVDFAPPLDVAAPEARYTVAVSHLTSGEPDKALALLAELARAPGCPGCEGVVDEARWDDAWRAHWDSAVLREILTVPPPDVGGVLLADPESDGDLSDGPGLRCPRGTKRKGRWDLERSGKGEVWCARGKVKHGPYRMREDGYDMGEGTQYASGDYKNGKKDGVWSMGESFGESSFGMYRDGKLHGLWVGERDDSSEWTAYVDGKSQGIEVELDADGLVTNESTYDAGVLHGRSRRWRSGPGHLLISEGSYDHGKKHGPWIGYDDQGRKRNLESYDHGVPHGRLEYWAADGASLGASELDHGTGVWIAFDDDGNKLAEGALVAGAKDGPWGERSEVMYEWETGEYQAGKRAGTWTIEGTGNPGGPRIAEGPFVAGERHGGWTYWREDGTKLATGGFVKGERHGTWLIYDPQGEVAQTLVFKKNRLVKVDGEKPNEEELDVLGTNAWDRAPDVLRPWRPE